MAEFIACSNFFTSNSGHDFMTCSPTKNWLNKNGYMHYM